MKGDRPIIPTGGDITHDPTIFSGIKPDIAIHRPQRAGNINFDITSALKVLGADQPNGLIRLDGAPDIKLASRAQRSGLTACSKADLVSPRARRNHKLKPAGEQDSPIAHLDLDNAFPILRVKGILNIVDEIPDIPVNGSRDGSDDDIFIQYAVVSQGHHHG